MITKQKGLYCHIPFCEGKCPYCNFYSIANLSSIPAYIEAIKNEALLYSIKESSDNPGRKQPVYDTLYIGGGTPSLLNLTQISDLLGGLRKCFSFSSDAEITIEVNPGDIPFEYLKGLYGCGINRLNIGIQSFNAKSLAFLHRRHSVADSESAVPKAREAGFKNIGIDLIYGLPHQGLDDWDKEMEKALALCPEHISCYQLTIEARTPFGKQLVAGRLTKLPEEKEYAFFVHTSRRLTVAGYYHYEVSNFARDKGLVSRHNSKYWQHAPYTGLGASAHSFSQWKRWWNHSSVAMYLKALAKWRLPIAGSEVLSKEQLRTETLYFAFRTDQGLDSTAFNREFEEDIMESASGTLSLLKREQKIVINGHMIHATLDGRAVADAMVSLF